MISHLAWLSFNSLAPGRPRCYFKTAISNLVLLIGIFTSSKDNALRWMPRDLTNDKSTLVQVMACCHQATGHYLSQCWPSFILPYDVTRPQWVKKCMHVTSNTWQMEMILANERICYICDVFSHWLRICSNDLRHTKKTLLTGTTQSHDCGFINVYYIVSFYNNYLKLHVDGSWQTAVSPLLMY